MASLQERNGSFRILFCYQGKRHTFTLGKVQRSEADRKAEHVDFLLMRIGQNLLEVPPGTLSVGRLGARQLLGSTAAAALARAGHASVAATTMAAG